MSQPSESPAAPTPADSRSVPLGGGGGGVRSELAPGGAETSVEGPLSLRWRPREVDRCRCGRTVFFPNSLCLACGSLLGYEPWAARVLAVVPAPSQGFGRPLWRRSDGADQRDYAFCDNRELAAGCNWLVPLDAAGEPADLAPATAARGEMLCVACRLNHMIPDQTVVENRDLWGKVELAKRRMVGVLLELGLPVRAKLEDDPEQGMAFDFIRTLPWQPRVMTGHRAGLITIDIEEADDVKREAMRTAMGEPYRTLLGHLRHEVGHYYWDRLVANSPWLAPFRELFGDERQDYEGSLQRHYAEGPRPDWALNHVSAYASTHPWEDWAETWAHYLHLIDTLETAVRFGIDPGRLSLDAEGFELEALYRPQDRDAHRFLTWINSWSELSGVLNELSRSMGLADFYPFVMSRTAVAKLQFVDLVVRWAAETPPPLRP